ncbi:Major royal jelly protein [Micromonospora pattaloongensis]|uniref:Major royal jelly protein n=1 Tax=Micromonospora pattaloongensis TaxID=405436 RepID=A0A1H3QW96_9ACTN|nr:L-dopachrome tautomerase-related protein [Micromonospora pattaloongensis]SDZ17717.1 Major royal jelly protein [Micromonospora pattaloongensis]
MTQLPTTEDPRLTPVCAADRVWTGVTTTPDGRIFVSFPAADGPGIQVGEVRDGTIAPYPDASWNAVREDHNPDGAFVRVNALRIGPDGYLWIVDAGAPGIGLSRVPGGPRLVVVDPELNQVMRVYDLDPVTRETSYVDDIRFNGRYAYLTDAGAPALIVLEVNNGHLRRVLDSHPSTTAQRPMYADGKLLRDQHGGEVRLHADQLEVSPDGRYLYFQPPCGPLSRVETRWLDDPDVSAATLAEHVETGWVDTPTTGGTAIDGNGVIYLSDSNQRRVLTIAPDGEVQTLIADPRLIWPDAMWVDARGDLWMPAAQLNLTPGFNGGRTEVRYPVQVYKLHVDAGPAPNDHA